MKKVIILLCACAIVFGFSKAALAATSGDVTLNVEVTANFELRIANPVIDLGSVMPGGGTSGSTALRCISNTGSDWNLSLVSTTLTDGSHTIPTDDGGSPPEEYIKFGLILDDDSAGTSTYEYDAETAQDWVGSESIMPLASDEIYASATAETGDFYHTALVVLQVPGTTPAGTFSSTLTFTMLEI